MSLKLNIGCGRDYREGWVNIDISYKVKAEAYLDIGKHELCLRSDTPERIESKTVDEIYISGVLEQIGPNEELIHAMNECHRVLKEGGKMVVVVPNAKYAIAHRDPMDIRKFTVETFSYFHKTAKEWELYGSVYGFKGWSHIRIMQNERKILTVTFTK